MFAAVPIIERRYACTPPARFPKPGNRAGRNRQSKFRQNYGLLFGSTAVPTLQFALLPLAPFSQEPVVPLAVNRTIEPKTVSVGEVYPKAESTIFSPIAPMRTISRCELRPQPVSQADHLKTEPALISSRRGLSSNICPDIRDIPVRRSDLAGIKLTIKGKHLQELFSKQPSDMFLATAPDNLAGQKSAHGVSQDQLSPAVAVKQPSRQTH